MSVTFSSCVLIPCYDHGATISKVVEQLTPFALPCIIVDDGSNEFTRLALEKIAAEQPNIILVRLEENAGKGAAVILGLQTAQQLGFSHAVQVDADGQHDIADVSQMLALAKQQPLALISGKPIYDDSIPRSRKYGRWATHIWVWIETLSFTLKDSMCGFRVYPIAPTLQAASQANVGKRMDFDTEIMVRLYWQGNTSYFIPTKVTYPKDGVSHFNALKDNLRISLMHTRLFFGMIPRIPSLLSRHRTAHWAAQKEVSGLWGMRFMLLVWRLLGRNAFSILLRPVVGIYWLTATRARQASQDWLSRVRDQLITRKMAVPKPFNSYHHFLHFANTMLDKIASWRGELHFGRDVMFAPGAESVLMKNAHQGKLLLASHLGDIESCRALAKLKYARPINALVFTENAQRFKQIMEEMAPEAEVNLLPVNDIGPETAIMLKEKLDRGEWVAIVGDRIAVRPQRGGDFRVTWSPFMGQPAPFAQGPFILASLLRCPVLLIFALHQQKKLHIYCEEFANPLLLPRASRQKTLEEAIHRYAARLEHYALLSPLDWFNFFDFWHLPDAADKE